MKFKYEPLMDSIKRRIAEEDRKGRHVTEVLLSRDEWVQFKQEVTPTYHCYDKFTLPIATVFRYDASDAMYGPGGRQVTIKQE